MRDRISDSCVDLNLIPDAITACGIAVAAICRGEEQRNPSDVAHLAMNRRRRVDAALVGESDDLVDRAGSRLDWHFRLFARGVRETGRTGRQFHAADYPERFRHSTPRLKRNVADTAQVPVLRRDAVREVIMRTIDVGECCAEDPAVAGAVSQQQRSDAIRRAHFIVFGRQLANRCASCADTRLVLVDVLVGNIGAESAGRRLVESIQIDWT